VHSVGQEPFAILLKVYSAAKERFVNVLEAAWVVEESSSSFAKDDRVSEEGMSEVVKDTWPGETMLDVRSISGWYLVNGLAPRERLAFAWFIVVHLIEEIAPW